MLIDLVKREKKEDNKIRREIPFSIPEYIDVTINISDGNDNGNVVRGYSSTAICIDEYSPLDLSSVNTIIDCGYITTAGSTNNVD